MTFGYRGIKVQYCPECDWVSTWLIQNDCIPNIQCENCNSKLKLKPLSECNFKQRAYLKSEGTNLGSNIDELICFSRFFKK